jgi:ribonuclease-3
VPPQEPTTAASAGLRAELPLLSDALLEQAFTHSSYLNEAERITASNERLEFLGDAVLDLVIAEHLFHRFEDAGEGELTRMRASVVRGDAIARIADERGYGSRLLLGKGEEAGGGRTRRRNLAGVFEAVVGAVFVEHGWEAARGFVLELLGGALDGVGREADRFDAKSALQQLAQARWKQPPEYETTETRTTDHGHEFTVVVRVNGIPAGTGTGRRKRDAQQEAARQALAALTEDEA